MGQRDIDAIAPSHVLKLLHIVVYRRIGDFLRDVFPLSAQFILDL